MEIQVPSTHVSSTSVLMGLATVNTVFLFLACQASIPYERDMNQVYKEPPCTCKSQAS